MGGRKLRRKIQRSSTVGKRRVVLEHKPGRDIEGKRRGLSESVGGAAQSCRAVRRCGRCREESDFDAAVAHGTRELAIARIECHHEAEVGVRRDHLNLAIDRTSLGQLEATARLEQRVEAIEDGWAAEVSIFDQKHIAVLHGLHERPVHPFEPCSGEGGLGRRDSTRCGVGKVGRAGDALCSEFGEDILEYAPCVRHVEICCLLGKAQAEPAKIKQGGIQGTRAEREKLCREDVLEEIESIPHDDIQVSEPVRLLEAAEQLERIDLGVHRELAEATSAVRGDLSDEACLARPPRTSQDGEPAHIETLRQGLERVEVGRRERGRRTAALQRDLGVVACKQRVPDLAEFGGDKGPRLRSRFRGRIEDLGEDAQDVGAIRQVAESLQVEEARVLLRRMRLQVEAARGLHEREPPERVTKVELPRRALHAE